MPGLVGVLVSSSYSSASQHSVHAACAAGFVAHHLQVTFNSLALATAITPCRIVLAVFLAVQWLADFAISWLPLYYDAKVAFVVMLWHPKVRGASFLYAQYLEPLLRSHEHSIDRNIGETRTWALDFATGHLAR